MSKLASRIPNFYLRVLLFLVESALVVYVMHFILPGQYEGGLPGINLNPLAEIGLFVILSFAGALIAFWITFGDQFSREEG
ncbi:MAG: hypothetical protein ACM3JD_04245 [Rudaea sp.]